MTSDELVETVARVLADGQGEHADDVWRFYVTDARAAIAIVLEEAARVAEGTRTEAAGNEYQSGKPGDFWDRDSIYGVGRDDCAAAIRSLIGKEGA